MSHLEKIQVISKILRYLVLLIATAVVAAFFIGQIVFGEWWVSIGDNTFSEIWQSGSVSHPLLSAVIAPRLLMMMLGIYWLQRLFGEFQRGEFFTESNMRCILWIVWLKVAAFIYTMLWPLTLNSLADTGLAADTEVIVDIRGLFDLLLMIVVLHLLKAARSIDVENKEFV